MTTLTMSREMVITDEELRDAFTDDEIDMLDQGYPEIKNEVERYARDIFSTHYDYEEITYG